ncbi:TPA: hypothetical protein EYP44_03645, partial [Candidatus Bathyarchaeota archaeon]|nr:hypothetical protein [Candidatus Bathyarchaeota archaeon]
ARLISSCAGTKAAPSVIVFNTLSWVRDGVVEVDLGGVEGLGEVRVEDCDGVALPHQVVDGKLVFIGRRIPALGFKEFKLVGGRRAEVPRTDLTVLESYGAIALENSHVRVTVDRRTGHITSIYDKANGREVISPGEGVSLQVYDDNRVGGRKPLYEVFDAVLCDAWEIYIYQQSGGLRCVELSDPESVEVIERGPVRSTVRVRYRYRQEGRRDSLFNVDVTLYSGTPLVILRLVMDWHALHRLVKTAFPLNVGSDYATYEIPYGSIRRRNPLSPQATLSERAKWEAPGQKWVDCSDGGEAYGVSILNDCKYGFDQANNVIRVTLLRSPSYPPKWPIGRAEDFLYEGKPTDQGHHEVGMAIYPHKGDWREALTVRRAYEFNYPLITCLRREPSGGAGKAGSHSFIRAEPENVVLTVVKRAEGSDDVILRFYEINGRVADAVISFDVEPVAVCEVNLIEEEISRLAVQGNFVRIPVRPHEIKTLKVRFPAKAR